MRPRTGGCRAARMAPYPVLAETVLVCTAALCRSDSSAAAALLQQALVPLWPQVRVRGAHGGACVHVHARALCRCRCRPALAPAASCVCPGLCRERQGGAVRWRDDQRGVLGGPRGAPCSRRGAQLPCSCARAAADQHPHACAARAAPAAGPRPCRTTPVLRTNVHPQACTNVIVRVQAGGPSLFDRAVEEACFEAAATAGTCA